MAYEVNANGAIAKVRNPWGVLGLSLITLGIYTIFWWYYVNREFRDFGAAMGDQELAQSKPGNSVLAITLGALIIVPAIISIINTVKREQRVQELAGVEKVNGWIVLILFLVIGIAVYPYMQSSLNKAWERYPSLEPGQGGAIPAPTTQAPAQPAQQPVAQQQPPAQQTPAQQTPAQQTPPPPPPPPAQ